jgi:hypothetical protein
MLNKVKEMKGPTSIYTPLGTLLKKAFKKVFMCALSKEAYWEPSLLRINYELIEI